jgi:hypothetical protein
MPISSEAVARGKVVHRANNTALQSPPQYNFVLHESLQSQSEVDLRVECMMQRYRYITKKDIACMHRTLASALCTRLMVEFQELVEQVYTHRRQHYGVNTYNTTKPWMKEASYKRKLALDIAIKFSDPSLNSKYISVPKRLDNNVISETGTWNVACDTRTVRRTFLWWSWWSYTKAEKDCVTTLRTLRRIHCINCV